MIRRETLVGVVGGVITGYIGWLVAYSVGDDLTVVGLWSPIVLVLSVLLAIWAALAGRRLRRRGNYPWAAFVFALPILPVLLTVAVLVDAYL